VGSPRISLLACHAEGDRLVGAEGWTLPRPHWTTAEDGRPLLLGLRAEDLSVETRGAATLEGELYGLEPLGDRTVVDVKVGSEMLKVKARPSVTGTAGERLSVTVDLDRAHVFAADTGLALSAAGR
jgi:ABC-type sugar transport system ATPase subunit